MHVHQSLVPTVKLHDVIAESRKSQTESSPSPACHESSQSQSNCAGLESESLVGWESNYRTRE